MRLKLKLILFVIFGGIMGLVTESNAVLTTYPAPSNASLSDDYVVTVDGQQLVVYRGSCLGTSGTTNYANSFGGPYSFAYFDFSGTVQVKVTSLKKPLTNVVIRPNSKGITFSKSGDTMTFTMSKTPCQISIEPDLKRGPLLLFANPLEQNVPAASDPNVLYYGPGMYTGNITMPSNGKTTLYIAGGAVIKGGLTISGSNVTVRGRGILDAQGTASLIRMNSASNVNIEGIIAKDGRNWNCQLTASNHVTFQNFKLLGLVTMNNDGIDICECQNVLIQDCFVRSEDDCIAIKGQGHSTGNDSITVRRSILWGDNAYTWRIGCESDGTPTKNLFFSDIDVLHVVDIWFTPATDGTQNEFGPGCISLQPSNEATFDNINFTDIRIHCAPEPSLGATVGSSGWYGYNPKFLVEIRPYKSNYGGTSPGKLIKNCYFKNISVYGEGTPKCLNIWVCGPDANHSVDNITFENFIRYGEMTTATSKDVTIGPNATNVRFLGSTSVAPKSDLKKNIKSQTNKIRFQMTPDNHYTITIPDKGNYTVSLTNVHGETIHSVKGMGPDVVSLKKDLVQGIYMAKVKTLKNDVTKKCCY